MSRQTLVKSLAFSAASIVDVDLGAIYYAYPGSDGRGYDFIEYGLGASRSFPMLDTGVSVGPDGFFVGYEGHTLYTFDNDTAFARHGLLASACAMATWFCDAYASWQKGAVENDNGRLRRDLPRDLLRQVPQKVV